MTEAAPPVIHAPAVLLTRPVDPPPALLALVAKISDHAQLPVGGDIGRLRSLSDEDRLEMVNDGRGDPIGRLLGHYVEVHSALDEAWDLAPQCIRAPRATLNRWIAAAAVVASRAWAWHGLVRQVVRPEMTRALRDVFAASWMAVMSALLHVRVLEACRDEQDEAAGAGVLAAYDPWPFALLLRADENLYIRALMATAGRASIVLSMEPVGRYSVRTWLYAFEGLVETRSQTGWTPASAEYFAALVLRYAYLLNRGADEQSPAEMRRVFDLPMLCMIGNGGGGGGVLPLPQGMRPEFIFKCERRMFYAMRHNATALNFYRARTLPPPPHHHFSNAWRIRALRALIAFVTDAASNTLLRTMIIDEVRNAFMGRHVLPGESEEVAFKQQLAPGKVPDADTVLYEMRRDTFMALQPLQKVPIRELFERWASAMIQALEKSADAPVETNWEVVAAQRPQGERAAVMVVERCLDVWLNYASQRAFSFGTQSFVDDASREPPRDCPPLSPQIALEACGGRAPVFVAISQLYACVDVAVVHPPAAVQVDAMDIDEPPPAPQSPPSTDVFVSPHFVDVLGTWLRAAVRLGRVARSGAGARSIDYCGA